MDLCARLPAALTACPVRPVEKGPLSALLHLSFSSPSLPIHSSSSPKGQLTLTLSQVSFSTSHSLRLCCKWRNITANLSCLWMTLGLQRVGKLCQTWRTSLLHTLCLANPIYPSMNGHNKMSLRDRRLGVTYPVVIFKTRLEWFSWPEP